MNLNCALISTHHLKKVSYRMLRRLHRLENSHSFENSAKRFGNNYCVVLYLRHINDMIKNVYEKDNKATNIVRYLNNIILFLADETEKNLKVHRSLLVSCLHKHTLVFNWLEENKVNMTISNNIITLWTMQCVPAYIGQFGNKI